MLRVHGFYGHVKRNDLRSAAMFLGFIVAAELMALVLLAVPLFFFDLRHSLLFPLGYLTRYVPTVLAAGICLFAVRFRNHVATVRETVAFRYVDRRSDPRLVNIVETLAIAAGLPLPKVGIIETSARNAFACGLTASSAVVVVTRGLLDALDDDELAGVVAHEIAHIDNGDIRLMAAANVLMEIVLRLRRRNFLQIGGWKRGVLAVFFPPFQILAALGGLASNVSLIVARLSRLLIAASREFVADAEAVRLTQKPEALVSALRKIEGRSTVAGIDPQADAMMIDGAAAGAFATHPTIAERIAVLTRFSAVSAASTVPTRSSVAVVAQTVPAFTAAGRLDIAAWRQQLAQPAPQAPRRAASLKKVLREKTSILQKPRQLVERVNEDVKDNLFGISPGARRAMMIGTLALVTMQFGVMYSAGRDRKAYEAAHAGEIEAGQRKRAAIEHLSASDPVEARCFATDYYAVGDRGLHRFHQPDAKLIEAFADGDKHRTSDVDLERYLGIHLRSVRDVERATPAQRDQALLAYVRTRKIMLEVIHRFFDDEGLAVAQAAYEGPRDQAIVASLRNVASPNDGRSRREIDLMTQAPHDFIPCVARAGLNGKGRKA